MAALVQEDGRAALKRVVEALWDWPEPLDMPDKRVEEEQALLEQFVIRYQKCYDFSTEQGVQGALGKRTDPAARLATMDNPFVQLFQALLEHRFLEGRWDQIASGNLRLVVLQCLRLLVRDKNFQRRFLLRGGRDELISIFDAEGEKHYDESSGQSLVGRQVRSTTTGSAWEALVAPKPPQGVLVCGHAGRVINEFSGALEFGQFEAS